MNAYLNNLNENVKKFKFLLWPYTYVNYGFKIGDTAKEATITPAWKTSVYANEELSFQKKVFEMEFTIA